MQNHGLTQLLVLSHSLLQVQVGATGQDQVPGCKQEEAAGLEMFANRPARLRGKHYRTYFCCTNVQDISAAKTTTQN